MEVVILLFAGVLVSDVCVRAVLLLLCPLCNPVGVVLLSFCIRALCIPCGSSLDFVLCRYSVLPKVAICNCLPGYVSFGWVTVIV